MKNTDENNLAIFILNDFNVMLTGKFEKLNNS